MKSFRVAKAQNTQIWYGERSYFLYFFAFLCAHGYFTGAHKSFDLQTSPISPSETGAHSHAGFYIGGRFPWRAGQPESTHGEIKNYSQKNSILIQTFRGLPVNKSYGMSIYRKIKGFGARHPPFRGAIRNLFTAGTGGSAWRSSCEADAKFIGTSVLQISGAYIDKRTHLNNDAVSLYRLIPRYNSSLIFHAFIIKL